MYTQHDLSRRFSSTTVAMQQCLDRSQPACYVAKALGEHLPAVRQALEALAAPVEPAELNRTGFRLYERFRPEVPPGAKGWGAKGVLDLSRISVTAS